VSTDERLLAVLAQNGHYDADGVHRGARPDTCRDCRRPVLVGLDAERCAYAATTDPYEIDEIGELLAVRIGLRTYNLNLGFSKKGKRQWTLDARTLTDLQTPRRTAVVAAHRCGLAIPAAKATFLSPTPRPVSSDVPVF
jgi:hypothetical protein